MNRLQIRELAEILSDTDGHEFPIDAHKDQIVSDEAKTLYAQALNIPTFPGKRVVTDIATTGAAAYPLVVLNFHRITNVYISSSTVQRQVLCRADETDRERTAQAPWLASSTWDVEVDPLVGLSLKLYPPIQAGMTLSVEYLVGHPGLSSDSSELYLPDPCGKLVAVRSAIKFIEKSDRDQRKTASLQQEAYALASEAFIALGSLGGAVPTSNYMTRDNDGYA